MNITTPQGDTPSAITTLPASDIAPPQPKGFWESRDWRETAKTVKGFRIACLAGFGMAAGAGIAVGVHGGLTAIVFTILGGTIATINGLYALHLKRIAYQGYTYKPKEPPLEPQPEITWQDVVANMPHNDTTLKEGTKIAVEKNFWFNAAVMPTQELLDSLPLTKDEIKNARHIAAERNDWFNAAISSLPESTAPILNNDPNDDYDIGEWDEAHRQQANSSSGQTNSTTRLRSKSDPSSDRPSIQERLNPEWRHSDSLRINPGQETTDFAAIYETLRAGTRLNTPANVLPASEGQTAAEISSPAQQELGAIAQDEAADQNEQNDAIEQIAQSHVIQEQQDADHSVVTPSNPPEVAPPITESQTDVTASQDADHSAATDPLSPEVAPTIIEEQQAVTDSSVQPIKDHVLTQNKAEDFVLNMSVPSPLGFVDLMAQVIARRLAKK